MTETTDTPWAAVGEPTAGFFYAAGDDLPGLPYAQRMALRSLEAAERLEERRRQEQLAEHHEQAYNRAVAESISRAHAAGKPWNPANPLEFYPSRDERVAMAFNEMDMRAAAELRAAKQAAVRTLRDHGINALVVLDASQPAPRGSELPSSAPDSPPSPSGSSPSRETAARSTTARIRAAHRRQQRKRRVVRGRLDR